MASVSLSPQPSAPAQAPPSNAHRTIAETSHEFRLANGRLSRRLRQEGSGSEVTGGQFSALGSLDSHGTLTLGELSELERVTPPSMNRTVNALVRAGLVSRQAASDDRRKIGLALTEAGSALVRETRKRRDAWIAQRFLTLSPGQRQTLVDATAIMKELADS
ncbi:MarR family winged helix-turn-helix transcriptional regulator [Glaciibacter sp. 2TAF33]|uniref:MarR family winged helix-turn-helix transcriptional regulator n=1 Tax=Glaciibacter sp. 2TAF33 TaxID=3233015 RepID=UPI003F926EFA